MKKLITLTLLLGIITLKSFSQIYYSFPDSTAIWNIEKTNFYNQKQEIRYGQFGDTLINSIPYHKILKLIDTTFYHPLTTYFCAIREYNKKIYVTYSSLTEQLLYDFNLQIGDSIKYNYSGFFPYLNPDTFYRKVISIDTIQLNDNTQRRHFTLEKTTGYNFLNDEWVEGIGSIKWTGLFNPFNIDAILNGDSYNPICVKVNDTLVYLGTSSCSKCFCHLFTPIIEINSDKDIILPFPNPTNDKVIFKFSNELLSPMKLRILDIKGKVLMEYCEINSKEYEVNMNWLKNGTYLFELSNGDKVINNGKLIKK